jgi:hypothetical protein
MAAWRTKLKFEVFGQNQEELRRRAEQVILDYFLLDNYKDIEDLVDVEMEAVLESEGVGFTGNVYVKIK